MKKPPEVPALMIGGLKPKLWRQALWESQGGTEDFAGLAPRQPGFREWVCLIRLQHRLINGETPVSIKYTQPLLVTTTNALFCYVPILRSNSSSGSAVNTNRFSIKISAVPGCTLTVKNGDEEYTVQAGGSIDLRPQHFRPILVGAKHESNK